MRALFFLVELLPRPPRHFWLYVWNLYPPYLFAGIRIHRIAPDFSSAETTLRLRWWNRNYIGTLFGGSLYSMCDPIHMVMLLELLGPAYLVRDKGAEIRFLRKGLGKVRARFAIDAATIAEIWAHPSEVQERRFTVEVRGEDGEVVAEVIKVLHIRRKSASKP